MIELKDARELHRGLSRCFTAMGPEEQAAAQLLTSWAARHAAQLADAAVAGEAGRTRENVKDNVVLALKREYEALSADCNAAEAEYTKAAERTRMLLQRTRDLGERLRILDATISRVEEKL